MNFRFWKKINNEKRMFYTFLIVHLIVWTSVGMIRAVLPTDTLEGIYWGSLFDLSSPKHPPLAGWLAYLFYIPKIDFLLYLFSQLFILIGFTYIYKLAKNFLNKEQSMLSVILLEGCWIYAYITGYYCFNPDTVLLLTLPAITYYFHCCTKDNKTSDWIKLGLFVGLSFLDKYQTGLLILGMFIWSLCFKREIFKNKMFYIAICIAFIIFSPHLFWLINNDFMTLLYFNSKLQDINILSHIYEPIKFLFMQILLIIVPVCIYVLCKLRNNIPFQLRKHINNDGWFLIILTGTPLLIHILIAMITGSNVRPQWNYVFWYMIGIMLLYFIPTTITKNDFKFILKSAYIVMFLIYISFSTMLIVEKNYRSRYPVTTVFNDFKQIWSKKFNTPLKYIGGFSEWTFPITIYGDTHPINIMDTYGYKNLWIDENDLKKSGALIISRRYNEVIGYTKISCPYLSKDFVIKPIEYKFNVYNALNMPREYTIYYFIVPPIK